MITSFSETTRVIDSRPIVGVIASRCLELWHTFWYAVLDGGTHAEATPRDDMARLALVPQVAAAATPRDELARLGLCCCGEPGARGDVWM